MWDRFYKYEIHYYERNIICNLYTKCQLLPNIIDSWGTKPIFFTNPQTKIWDERDGNHEQISTSSQVGWFILQSQWVKFCFLQFGFIKLSLNLVVRLTSEQIWTQLYKRSSYSSDPDSFYKLSAPPPTPKPKIIMEMMGAFLTKI